jgi:hypothetical protein
VLTPRLDGSSSGPARIVVEGVFQFGYGGTRFDARYRAKGDGAFDQPHEYLSWSPQQPELESEDPANHRYVYRVPTALAASGQSLGLRLDVDRLVSEYLITPSEARQSLAGGMRVRVLQAPPPPQSLGALLGWVAAPALLTVSGVGWVVRRRMRFQGLDADLRERVERIDERYAHAQRAARAQSKGLAPLDERLRSLRSSTLGLARQAQELRRSRRQLDQARIVAEVAAHRERLAGLTDERVRGEAASVLAAKERTLALFGDLESAETHCLIRLEKIEAVLETTALSLRGTQGQVVAAAAAQGDDPLCRALDAEVMAIREVQEELVRCGRS